MMSRSGGSKLPRRFCPAKKSERQLAVLPSFISVQVNYHLLNLPSPNQFTTAKMVKLTEVEDEHFSEKPIPSKNDALLVSDDEEDYTDTGKCLTNSRLFSPFSPFESRILYRTGMRHQMPLSNHPIRVDIP
jgi:hypothetical protein